MGTCSRCFEDLCSKRLVLHPGLKLEYFRKQEWEADWIDVAESLVRDEYEKFYEKDSDDVMEVTDAVKDQPNDKVPCPHPWIIIN